MMIEIERDNLLDLLKLSRFAHEEDYTRFPGIMLPWSIRLDSFSLGLRVLATDGRVLVWMKSPVEIEPIGRVPDLLSYIKTVESVSEWKPLSMSHPVCEYCSDPDETCEFCTTRILNKKFNLNRVLKIQNTFGIEGVAIVDEKNLAFKFRNGFAYLMGIYDI